MKTEFFKINDVEKQKDKIYKAAEFIKNGETVIFPTETVYGLGANALNPEAVKKIFIAKGRPQDNPLIVHISELSQIYALAENVTDKALELFRKYAPGPLTVILPKKNTVPDEVTAGQKTVAIRFPSHPIANAFIKACGVPVAAPSANISGSPSPTSFNHVKDDMNGRVSAIIDGGDCHFGIESTVITLAANPPRLLRPGAITVEELKSVLGEIIVDEAVLAPLQEGKTAASPGMKYKHYAPKAKISIVKGNFEQFKEYTENHKNEADFLLVFEGEENKLSIPSITFGKEDDSFSQSHRLFDALRELDEKGAKNVFARDPSQEGIGLGVCNRLYRAAGFTFVSGQKPKVIGVAGASGAGKSTVCEYLRKKGAIIINADEIAREITKKGSNILNKISNAFGADVINENGELNRRLLAKKAFSSEKNTTVLNSITHPEIKRICTQKILQSKQQNKNCVIDAPLLFSSGLYELCDITVRVYAPENIRKERIFIRDKISYEEIEKRFASQKEEIKAAEKADYTINNYPPYNIYEETDKIFALI